jgi:hypothetical protein
VNLQYGDTEAEQGALRAGTGLTLTNVDCVDNTNDLDGLAALIEACDLVVTISNTTAHLAGALGKPVLILLPDGPGLRWYWHLQRRDSRWYPSARLFRQDDPAEWDGVVEAIRQELLTHVLPRAGDGVGRT